MLAGTGRPALGGMLSWPEPEAELFRRTIAHPYGIVASSNCCFSEDLSAPLLYHCTGEYSIEYSGWGEVEPLAAVAASLHR